MKTSAWLVPLALCAPACLENEEEIVVHPDGSLTVTLASKGGVSDLAHGDPLPLGPAWRAASADTERWLRVAGRGPDAAAARAAWPRDSQGEEPELALRVTRDFGSVAELPRTFASESDPYRSAGLARSTALAIEVTPAGRVYAFERTFHGFDRARIDPLGFAELPEELEAKLDEGTLTPVERARIVALVGAAHERAAETLAREALAGLYTHGEVALPTDLVATVVAATRAGSRAAVDAGRLGALLALAERDGEAAGHALDELQRAWRGALRTALESALAGVPVEARNAALYALEWQLTAFDRHGDAGDETFTLRLTLPGTLVSGNWTALEGGVAVWELAGEDLDARDVVLRAVSIVPQTR
jgi:hypothetical protein